MTAIQLRFLGPPQLARDERPVALSSAKAVALLAYLAMARRPQSRERLLGLLWATSATEAAQKNLRNTLWAIRKALGEDVLSAQDDHLALGDAVWADVREFEALAEGQEPAEAILRRQEAVLTLYRGPFLDGLTLTDAPEFENWLALESERLAQLYLRTLARLVSAYREQANWQEVIALARRALAHDNLQEPMHRALMEAHARLGERAEALRQYDALRTTLAQTLGVDPLPETEALRAAIIGGELQPIGGPVPAAPRPPGRQRRSGESMAPPFVGRQAERAMLDVELQAAASGPARVVLLTGEIGIGKSRLWQEWSAGLPPGITALESCCLEATQALPFAPLAGLFRSRVCTTHLLGPDCPIPPMWLAEIARFVPEIRAALPALPALAALPQEEERYRLFEAFTQFLAAFKARPLVLFIDDLHWADHATLDWLGYLVYRLRDQPLLLIAAYRPEEAPTRLTELVAGWAREGVVQRLPLQRLTNEESAALIAALGVEPMLTHRVQAQSAGNPYFLIELARAGPGDVPPALTELIRARLERLGDPARQVLQAAAMLEPDFDFAVLRRTSGRGEEEVLDALDALLNAAVLIERGGRYTFAHPLVAAVVRGGLSGARRAFLYRRAAEALEATYAGRLSQIAGRLAAYYAQAGDGVQAGLYAERAAEHALALAAPAEAVDFYRQALALDPTPARQLGLGQALLRQEDLAEARAAFEAALSAAEAEGDQRSAARACLGLAETHLPEGRADEAARWMEKSLTYLDPGADPEAHALAHFLLGASRLDAGQSLAQSEKELNEAVRLAAENNLVEIGSRSRFILGNVLAQRGDLTGALQAFRDSITLAQAAGNPYQEVLGHNNTAYHALLAGDLAAAHKHVEAGLTLAETRALHLPLQYLYSTRGEIALAEQQWADAEGWFKRALAEAERNGNVQQATNILANLGLVARGRGDSDQALALLETACRSAEKLTAPYLQMQIDLWLAELFLERGERAAADEALRRAQTRPAAEQYARLWAWAGRLRHASLLTAG